MEPDLMTFGDHPALLVGIEQGHHRRHVEGRGDAVPGQQFEDVWHADAIAILAPRHASDGLAAVTQLIGVVVGIEGEREGGARPVLPPGRPVGPAGADLVDEAAPVIFRPLPGFELGHVGHVGPPG
jgi:hypothetical protein